MIFYTELDAVDPATGELKKWAGPEIEAASLTIAREMCDMNGLGYLRIVGRVVAEIPCKPGTYDPDWSQRKDFYIENN